MKDVIARSEATWQSPGYMHIPEMLGDCTERHSLRSPHQRARYDSLRAAFGGCTPRALPRFARALIIQFLTRLWRYKMVMKPFYQELV